MNQNLKVTSSPRCWKWPTISCSWNGWTPLHLLQTTTSGWAEAWQKCTARGGWASYAEALPLTDGYEERIPLYQLYPLLVQVHLFGGSYAAQVDQAQKRLPG